MSTCNLFKNIDPNKQYLNKNALDEVFKPTIIKSYTTKAGRRSTLYSYWMIGNDYNNYCPNLKAKAKDIKVETSADCERFIELTNANRESHMIKVRETCVIYDKCPSFVDGAYYVYKPTTNNDGTKSQTYQIFKPKITKNKWWWSSTEEITRIDMVNEIDCNSKTETETLITPSNCNNLRDMQTEDYNSYKNVLFWKCSPAHRSGGCFKGDCTVTVVKNELDLVKTNVSELKKGDVVLTGTGEHATIVCVMKMICDGGKSNLVQLDCGLAITPYHPIYMNGKWLYPGEMTQPSQVDCDAVYNFVLDSVNTIEVNGITCICFGNDIQGDPVASHPFYGSHKVIDELKSFVKGWERGKVVFADNFTIKEMDENGRIFTVGFNRNHYIEDAM
jgi:hypothetical protein